MRFVIDRKRFEQLDQCRSFVPRQIVAGCHHVVAGQRRQWNRANVFQAQLVCEFLVSADDAVIHGLVVVDQVHLVDRNDHVFDTQQMSDGRMALGLRQQFHAAIVAQFNF